MFKDSSPSQLLLPCLIYLVSVMIWIFNWVYFIFFVILTIATFISEFLLGNTPVTMAILQKCLGTFSS